MSEYNGKVSRDQGGDKITVASGGAIDVQSGGKVGRVCGVTIGVAAEDNDAIAVTIQLTDAAGEDLDERCCVFAYVSDDANGDSIAGTAPDTLAIGTDGLLIPVVDKKAFHLVSEADGDIDLAFGEDGADTWYLIVVLPDGTRVASGAITFAA